MKSSAPHSPPSYRIGDLSRLLSLPPSAIRYYEEQGLVTPEKDWQSRYRSFDHQDGCRILGSKIYRSMGFSLRETRMLITESNHHEVGLALEKRIVEVEAEIERLGRLRQILTQTADEHQKIPDAIAKPRFEQRSGFVHLGGGTGNSFFLDDVQAGVAGRWLNWLPLTRPAYVIPQAYFRNTSPLEYCWGYALEDQDFERLGEIFRPPLVRHPAGLCVYSVIEKSDNAEFCDEHFAAVKGFLKEQNLSCSGPALGFTLGIIHRNEQEVVRFSVTIPVEHVQDIPS